jgi:mannose-6-phosphate isomerase-like protein (cupin superfamily)
VTTQALAAARPLTTLTLAGAPYVRTFSEPRDFGRPGLSHVTLHGAVQHGAREARQQDCHTPLPSRLTPVVAAQVEVWQQAFAPQAGTPIHRHDCEEVFIVLAGSGTLRVREGAGSEVRQLQFSANSTLVVQPNFVHQVCCCAALHACCLCSRQKVRR